MRESAEVVALGKNIYRKSGSVHEGPKEWENLAHSTVVTGLVWLHLRVEVKSKARWVMLVRL